MSGKLFLSFWDLCLDNLSEGSFSHRSVSGQEARVLIEHARQEKRLFCVAEEDLLAPYGKDARDRHRELCRVLKKQFGVPLSLRDFLMETEHEGASLYSAMSLQFAQVHGEDRLLIVTCSYEMPQENDDTLLHGQVAVDTVKFHLIEAT